MEVHQGWTGVVVNVLEALKMKGSSLHCGLVTKEVTFSVFTGEESSQKANSKKGRVT